MNAQEARNHLALEELKRSLRGGSITEDELKARLLRIMEQEEQKGPARMDTAFISSCENLLWALHAPQTQTIRSSKREAYLRLREGMRTQKPAARPGWARACLALAGAALVMGLFYITLPRPQPEALSAAATDYGTPLPVRESLSPGGTMPTAAPTPSPTPEPTPEPSQAPPEALPAQTMEPGLIDALAAGDKYMNLKDLRAQAPARFRYAAEVDSRPLRIDAPVIIPQGDAMPVPRLRWLQIDEAALRRAMAGIAGDGTTLSIGGDGSGIGFAASSMTGDRPYFDAIPGKIATDVIITNGGEPENNPFTSRQAYDLTLKLLENLDVDPGQVSLYAQAGTSARYKVGSVDDRSPDRYAHFYTDQPIEGYEQGFHILVASQTLDGIPVFPNGYHWSGPNFEMDNRLRMRILNQKEFTAEGRLIRAEGIKIRDLPLANIGRVFDTLRWLIEKGRLREVDRIQLGYELFYEQHVKSGSDEREAALIAVPVWQVLGRLYGGAAEGDSYYQMIARDQYETSAYTDASFELRINAQTGEYIDPYSENSRTYNPALLTWEQMEGEDDVSLYK